MGKRIDPASLREGGKVLKRVGGDIGDANDTLKSATTSTNSPWGGDELGSIFAELYPPLAEKAFDFYGEASAAVTELGEWLYKRAKDNEETEDKNKQDVEDAAGD